MTMDFQGDSEYRACLLIRQSQTKLLNFQIKLRLIQWQSLTLLCFH